MPSWSGRFRVKAIADGLPTNWPDGNYSASPELTPAEVYLQELVEQHFPDRQLIASRVFRCIGPTPDQPWPRSSSPGLPLRDALATGKVTFQPDAVGQFI